MRESFRTFANGMIVAVVSNGTIRISILLPTLFASAVTVFFDIALRVEGISDNVQFVTGPTVLQRPISS